MTGKLIKYEFNSIIKIMGIVWVALLASSLLTGISNSSFVNQIAESGQANLINIISALSNFLYAGTIMALIAVTIVVIVVRFYKGLLKEEGYLMHTLPVKTWQLITAKGFTAGCVSLISIAVGILSGFIVGMFFNLWEVKGFFTELFKLLVEEPLFFLICLELFVLLISLLLCTVYKVYASMAIGQLANKNRVLFSVLAYMGIGAAGTVLNTIALTVFSVGPFQWIIQCIYEWMSSKELEVIPHIVILVVLIFQLIKLAIFHIVTEQILSNKLNLE